jgi:HEAT repeat protein
MASKQNPIFFVQQHSLPIKIFEELITMKSFRFQIVIIALIGAIFAVNLTTEVWAGDSAKTAKQIAVLESDAPYFQKVLACKRLANVGTKEAVPVLAKLLGQPKMSHYARFALQPIPEPSVDAALRDAAEKLDGLLQIGCINSIGYRKDAQAIPLLAKLIKSENDKLANAAAAALGQIGTPESAALLVPLLKTAKNKAATADSCLACAEELAQKGNSAAAIDIYDTVRQSAGLPIYSVAAATRGAILTRGADGTKLIVEQLENKNDRLFQIGIETTRMTAGDATTDALIDVVAKLPAKRQALLLSALASRGGEKVLAVLLDKAHNSTGDIQLAALTSLRDLDDPSSVPVLFAAAISDDANISDVARQTLVALKGDKVDQAILNELKKAKGNALLIAIRLAGSRKIDAAAPVILKSTEDSRMPYKIAAITSFGETCPLDGLGALAKFCFASGQTVEPAQKALLVACKRMPKDACCEKLASLMTGATVEQNIFLLNLIGTVGGTKALELAGTAALDKNGAIQDAATRVLGKWFSPDVAPVLLKIAQESKSKKYRVRTLRGYIRIFRQLGLPNEQKLDMAGKAMKLAERKEERLLVLEAINRIQSPEALAYAISYLDNAELKAQAAATAVTIGEKIAPAHPKAVAPAMQKVIDAGPATELLNKATIILNQTKK